MSTLPASVRIGPYDFTVREWTDLDAINTSRVGQVTFEDGVMCVVTNRPRAKVVATLLHEILHAIRFVYGIRDRDDEERTVEMEAVALTALWRDNPSLLSWVGQQLAGPQEVET